MLNYVASADWVVALFPKAFQTLESLDIGSGGHDGFSWLAKHQIKYIKGGHSAALKEQLWDAIAQFIVHGDVHEIPPPLRRH